MDRTITWQSPHHGEIAPESGFAERYEDLGLIAQGGMGEVRRVRDRQLGRVVAMKILAIDRIQSMGTAARFVAEATITAQLVHPGIIAVFDRGERSGTLWYTMTEVRGATLAQRILASRGSPDGLRSLVQILHRVCEAIAYAHSEGVIHRDLKPDNIMVGPFGEVLVMDWGIACKLAEPAGAAGTPGWVAPEQARGETPAPQADIYALGGVLHAFLMGGPQPLR